MFLTECFSGKKKKEDFRFTSLARDRKVVPEHEGALHPNFVAVNSIQMLRPENRQSERGQFGNTDRAVRLSGSESAPEFQTGRAQNISLAASAAVTCQEEQSSDVLLVGIRP